MDDPGGQMPDGHHSAKRLGRRATLKLIGLSLTGAAAGAATPSIGRAQAPAPSVRPHPGAGKGRAWRHRPLAAGPDPRTFTADEIAALGALVGLIIPDTDTPGARTAGVHWYLDDAARTEKGMREQIRTGLRRLDGHAHAAHGRPFAALPEPQQAAILSMLDGGAAGSVRVDQAGQPQVTGASAATNAVTPDDRSFFAFIKAQTIDAYYKSEMGQIGELEWVGHEFNDTFPGACTHGDSQVHPRPRWPRSRG